ncbi:MAG: Gfo/Idh/MocA family oxidoreductase [Caldilineaceae bacterium]|nr:Gfo/Idh/MocA family oxidoreductase [Caldilineaceae bacterium]
MTLKVAIVGTGKVATQNYLPYLAQHKDLTLSYYNRSQAKAADAAAQFGGRVASSLADLVADDPDTILVLTREADRYAVAKELIALRPRRIFFEKPLVAQRGQADVTEDDFAKGNELLTTAHAAGIETAMVFNYRFFEQTQKAHELIASHQLGQPVHFTGLVHYACWSHCIDLILAFMGPAATISALAAPVARPCMGTDQVRDVTAAVQLANGATGTIIGTCSIDFKLPLYELTVAFERGRISMRDLDGDLELIDYTQERHTVHALSRNISRWDQYRASFGKAVNAYLDTVRAGTPPPVPGLAGLHELQFEAALKRSIAQGVPVHLADAFPVTA